MNIPKTRNKYTNILKLKRILFLFFFALGMCISAQAQTFTFTCEGRYISAAECPECTGSTTARLSYIASMTSFNIL